MRAPVPVREITLKAPLHGGFGCKWIGNPTAVLLYRLSFAPYLFLSCSPNRSSSIWFNAFASFSVVENGASGFLIL